MPKHAIVVLAAGIGSRYRGTKQLETITRNGETIIDFSIYDAAGAGFSKVVFVVRKAILDDVRNHFEKKLEGRIETQYVCQDAGQSQLAPLRKKPWGTGHALLSAKPLVGGNFCVINADDFYGRNAFEMMFARLKNIDPQTNDFALAGYRLANTLSPGGPVSRGQCEVDENGFLIKIIERTNITEKDGKVVDQQPEGRKTRLSPDTIVSMNFWGFTPCIFHLLESGFQEFLRKYPGDLETEFFLPRVVHDFVNANPRSVRVLINDSPWMGITYPQDTAIVRNRISDLQNEGHYPFDLWK